MKYLRSYSLFESSQYDEIHDVIEDILLDLQDNGFKVICNHSASTQHASYEIRLERDTQVKFTWDEISVVMFRIYDYLIEFGEKLTFSFINPNKEEYFRYTSNNPDKNWILTKDTLRASFPLYYDKFGDTIMVYFDLGEDPYQYEEGDY